MLPSSKVLRTRKKEKRRRSGGYITAAQPIGAGLIMGGLYNMYKLNDREAKLKWFAELLKNKY